MKWYVVLSVFSVMFCVRDCDSFKILKKLKDILHPTVPTVSTTTVLPTIPAYEKHHGHKDDDSSSWERESSTPNIKSKHSEEDLSTSQSSENQGDSFSNSKKKYNSVEPKETKPYPGNSFQPSTPTTETNNYNSVSVSNNEELARTTTDIYDQSNNNDGYPGHSSIQDVYNNEEVKSTTPNSYDFVSQNKPDQLPVGVNSQRNQTENNYDGSYNSNLPEQSSSFGGVPGTVGPSTSTAKYGGSQDNYDDQSAVFNNVDSEKTRSSTPRYYEDSSYSFNKPDQSSSVDKFYGENSQTNPSNNGAINRPEQLPSYNYDTSVDSTTTPKYENTDLNEVDPGLSSGNGYNAGSFVSTSTMSTSPDDISVSSGNQHKESSGLQPSYSTTKGSNQTKYQDNGGIIMFPDHPSLNPTPETERIYGENDNNFKSINGQHNLNQTPAPVTSEHNRNIVDAPSKDCGPGQILDKNTNMCKELARK